MLELRFQSEHALHFGVKITWNKQFLGNTHAHPRHTFSCKRACAHAQSFPIFIFIFLFLYRHLDLKKKRFAFLIYLFE